MAWVLAHRLPEGPASSAVISLAHVLSTVLVLLCNALLASPFTCSFLILFLAFEPHPVMLRFTPGYTVWVRVKDSEPLEPLYGGCYWGLVN